MIYLTLVIFAGFLLIVWFLVKLLFRLERKDSIEHDQRQLWENSNVTLKEMRYQKQKNK
ncbi:hypothetical protein BRE01_32290 [Brevibacillus reuszeri]|uniref:Uncharacterized protein n=1 Tax=Brevibacillus reuszeri TaxID=54915 RepID=A0ABQ0TNW8_9BACL|nr:hypothetical protein [Brevibacillus reuszeri]MED1858552.1 hypothetical protein [Brevibacillus reuszeri]GED69527.1 hypothetical protein BRE01_32290 [Brevibacillus reuszeri]